MVCCVITSNGKNALKSQYYLEEEVNGTQAEVSATDLECLHSLLRVLLLDTKPWGKMEAPIWGPSTCVVLDHFKDGGGEEDAMRFTHTCLSGGQR